MQVTQNLNRISRIKRSMCPAEIDVADNYAGEPCDPEHDLNLDTFEVDEEVDE